MKMSKAMASPSVRNT